jgi:tryptophan synthase beta chain
MKAYEDYFAGKITKHALTQEEIDASIARLNTPLIPN